MEKETGKHLAGGRKQPRGRKSKEKRPKKPSRLTRQQKLLIALAVVTVLHLWKRNMLLSIGAGTAVYIVLVQLVFA